MTVEERWAHISTENFIIKFRELRAVERVKWAILNEEILSANIVRWEWRGENAAEMYNQTNTIYYLACLQCSFRVNV